MVISKVDVEVEERQDDIRADKGVVEVTTFGDEVEVR